MILIFDALALDPAIPCTMSSGLGMEPYAAVPYNPYQEWPHSSFTDSLQNDALMSQAFTYPDPNEELWQMINTLPQLSNAANVPSHDGFSPATSLNHSYVASTTGSNPYLSPTRPSTSTSFFSPNHANTEPLIIPQPYIPQPSALKHAQPLPSELHLCKNCCAAVQALIRYLPS